MILAAAVLLVATPALLLALSWIGARMVLTGPFKTPIDTRPEDLRLGFEAVAFPTRDGLRLKGWLVPALRPTERTVVVCHGWAANKGDMLRRTHFLAAEANLLYFDCRFCGESEGDLLSVGFLEAMDFDAAMGFLKTRRPALVRRLGAYGQSMGAAVVLAGMTRHRELAASVLESPYLSHDQAVARFARSKLGVPYYPLMPLALWWIRLRLGADPETLSPRRLLDRLDGAAVLLAFGEKDPLVSPDEGRALFEPLRSPKRFVLVPGAGHGECHESDDYRKEVVEFYGSHL